jgi:hypothetical protein
MHAGAISSRGNMSNLREISDARVASLGELSNKPVTISDLDHMKSGKDLLDLNRAKTWIEVAAAERITKDPRRQSADENEQLKTLLLVFPEIRKPEKRMFLYGGNLITDKSQICDEDPSDIDATMKDEGWQIVWTLKGGQNVDGTNQHRQFLNVLNTINQAPARTSSNQILLAVFVNGIFWVKLRKKYKNFHHTPPFSLVDLLNDKAQDKKCVVFSDLKFPVSPFHSSYIKDIYV